jgi:hypothetical protein
MQPCPTHKNNHCWDPHSAGYYCLTIFDNFIVWELEAAAGSTEAMSIEETENSNEDMGAKSLIE